MSDPTPLTSNDASLDSAGAPKPMGFGGNLLVNLFIPLGMLGAAAVVVAAHRSRRHRGRAKDLGKVQHDFVIAG